MTDVLLTHSYHLWFDRKQVRKMQPYPPLGTLYAAALLREKGIDVAVFDTMLRNPEEEFREALRLHRPRIVALYEDDFNFLTKMCLTRMRDVARQILNEAKQFGCRVLVHGSDATDHADEYLRSGFDFVLVFDAEQSLIESVQAIGRGLDPSHIPGVFSRLSQTAGTTPHRTIRRSRSTRIPPIFPARDLIDFEPYRKAWLSAHGKFSLNLVASRGCPFRCNWCAKPIFGDSYRAHPPGLVAREMELLKHRYGAQHLWFADDIFGLNRHWVIQLAEEVKALDCALPFKIQARADLLSPETATALRSAGCAEIWMGVESGSQDVLNAMDKGLRVEDVIAARENLRRQGIRACFFLQFGYPGESWDDIRKTIALVRATRPDDVGVSVSYPLPNTRFYDRVKKQLGSKRNWSDSDDLCVMFKGAYTDEFYRAVGDALHAEVDSWSLPEAERLSQETFVRNQWQRIESLEPVCRNSDATKLPQVSPGSLPPAPGEFRRDGFVSIRSLAASLGEG